MYLTPTKLRNMGLGTALPTTDAALKPLINVASLVVNRECAAPRNHDFRGGTVLNEQHPWDLGNDHVAGNRRVFPYHWPAKEITGFRIRVTQGSMGVINFPADQLYNNIGDGYIEIVSLSLTTASVYAAGLIPNIGLATPVAELDYEYGEEFSITDEELASTSGDAVFYADSQFWTDDAVAIKVGGTPVTTGFTIDRNEGKVTFNVAQVQPVTASYISKLSPDISIATALVANDLAAQTRLNTAGLQGLQSIHVLEVELRQGRSSGWAVDPINPAAAILLEGHRFRTFG